MCSQQHVFSVCAGKTRKGVSCKNKGCYLHNNERFCMLHIDKIDEKCTICMNALFDIDVLSCGHMFHTKCIQKWIRYKKSCPICRCIVFDNNKDINITRSSDLASIQLNVMFEVDEP